MSLYQALGGSQDSEEEPEQPVVIRAGGCLAYPALLFIVVLQEWNPWTNVQSVTLGWTQDLKL